MKIDENQNIIFSDDEVKQFNQTAIQKHKDNSKLYHKALLESGLHFSDKCPICNSYLGHSWQSGNA